MLRALLLLSCLFLLGVACVPSPPPPISIQPLPQPVRFLEDVKPILDSRCAVCHSCYNSACQLKLTSYEGIDRGGSKAAVYSSSRLQPQAPTRLFLDAQTTPEWRDLGFHGVVSSQAPSPANDSVMLYLLEAKRLAPQPSGDYQAEAAALSCPANPTEVGTFLGRNPGRGMPFGFPALSEQEHLVLASWLYRGAPGPSPEEQAQLIEPTSADAAVIETWESFLNRNDPKHALTARYLYEHFFLAHLRFPEADSGDYFELVRSATGPGEPISVISTTRPYDDPGVDTVYYRFRKIHSTIVHKTHMVVDFGAAELARVKELFIHSDWLEEPHRMPYQALVDANPFLVYAQIPPIVRYRFLLDHSEYMIRTFIRGPVCKGQVALNVIHDHFWLSFLDPDSDLTVLLPEFLVEQADNLRLPNEEGSGKRVIRTFSNDYRRRYENFYRAKTELYDRILPDGQGIDAIWPGRRAQDSPLLTVYRHFDSASVHKGALGTLPRTHWVIDYSQFERIYYALVAGFDVFGNLSHQVNVRRYMDYLRLEGELNFLQFMPPESRIPMIQAWYIGDGAMEATSAREILNSRGTRVHYETDDPKREFVEQLVEERFRKDTDISFDEVNYQRAGREVPMPTSFDSHEDVLDGFRALTAPGTGFIRHVNETGVNVLYARIRDYQGEDRFISIVINRWHDNVNSLFFERNRLDSTKDTMDFFTGQMGSYPNYFLDVPAEEIPEFFDILQNFDDSDEYLERFHRYGVNRADENFWEIFDWFQAKAFEAEPIQAGLLDLNRYHSEATVAESASAP